MVQITKVDNIPYGIQSKEKVTLKICGTIVSAVYVSKRGKGSNIVKIDKHRYIDKSTGEVKFFKQKENRQDNIAGVKKSLCKLRDYINTNVTDTTKAKWITLTYAENMQDTKKLYTDFDKFIKRLRYKYGHCEYIVAMEPQGRGAWHAHLLCIYDHKAPYIANAELADLWGNGFVRVTKLDNVSNIGAYLTAYLGDIEFCSDTANIAHKGNTASKNGKKYIKGGRLHFYPIGFNLFRCSRGIKSPQIEQITELELQELTKHAKETYKRTIHIQDENGFNMYIQYRYYKTDKIINYKEYKQNENLHLWGVA